MGITYLEVEVGNLNEPERTERLNFLVDSDAMNSVVPAAVLERLGVRPLGEQVYRLANGSTITRRKGGALFRLGSRFGVADVVFGETGDATLLGATTLASLGLSLNPLKRELVELPMVL